MMKRKIIAGYLVPLVVGFLTLSTVGAEAGAPTDQLKRAIDRVINIFNESSSRPGAERQAAIRKVVDQVFDFQESARQSLGLHWRDRTKPEREEFVKLFRALLERSYISRIERYRADKVVYLSEAVDGDDAMVRTKILSREGTEIPVDYRMRGHGERWLVYDVSIENVSLVSNYRSQFNDIVETSSYQELVRKIKQKLEASGPRSTTGQSVRPPEYERANDFWDLAGWKNVPPIA